MTTTAKELEQLVVIINNRAPKRGHRYAMEYAYGRPRLILEETKRPFSARDISPRLPKGQMRDWLHAFLEGMDECRRR